MIEMVPFSSLEWSLILHWTRCSFFSLKVDKPSTSAFSMDQIFSYESTLSSCLIIYWQDGWQRPYSSIPLESQRSHSQPTARESPFLQQQFLHWFFRCTPTVWTRTTLIMTAYPRWLTSLIAECIDSDRSIHVAMCQQLPLRAAKGLMSWSCTLR